MDKYEFKLRSEEIEKLMDLQDYKSAVRLADTIDWRRVKSVATLVKIAELYRHNKRFEESRDLLELAYDRNPSSRNVVYGLCEISLEFGDIVAAIEYFKEFAKLAPNDSGVYILRYRIYEAQNVGFEDRIELLEELKKKDRMEEWEYQLAYLYHRAGFATKCVEECDEIILWFGEGPYVIKAMELKMLHEPLTPSQQEKYDKRNESKFEEAAHAAKAKTEQNPVIEEEDDDFRVKTIDMSKYNTINLQAELAANLKEFIDEEPVPVAQEVSSEPVEVRGEKEVFHNTIPADANEIFFADKTEDMRYAVPVPETQTKETPELATFKENYAQDMAAASSRDVQEIQMPKEPALVETPRTDDGIDFGDSGEVQVEKQITGQMCIQDILDGWERMKEENTQRFREEVRKQLLEQTGEMFAEFDENTKSGMLSSLDRPEQIDSVLGSVSPTVMKGLDQNAVTPIANAVPTDTIVNETVVGVLPTQSLDFEQILPQGAPEKEVWETPVAAETAGEISAEPEEEPEGTAIQDEVTVTEETAEEVVSEEEIEEETALEEETEETTFEPEEEIQEEVTEASETVAEEKAAEPEEPEVMRIHSGYANGTITGTIPGNIWKEVESSIEDDARAKEVESMIEEDEILPTLAEAEPIREVKAVHDMTPEEKELFAPFLYSKRMKFQLIETLECLTLASYSGNVLISSDDDESAVSLAKQIVRFVQSSDDNFSGKVAKIKAESLNKKDIAETFGKLENGALLVEHASAMNKDTIKNLLQGLNQENLGIVVILMDRKSGIQKFVDKIPYMKEFFNGRVDIIPMSMEMLISYALKYTREQGYTIDDMGHLALSKRVSDMRRGNHTVTIEEVKEIVNEAIRRSGKKKLFNKPRKDEDGYTILKEKDFE